MICLILTSPVSLNRPILEKFSSCMSLSMLLSKLFWFLPPKVTLILGGSLDCIDLSLFPFALFSQAFVLFLSSTFRENFYVCSVHSIVVKNSVPPTCWGGGLCVCFAKTILVSWNSMLMWNIHFHFASGRSCQSERPHLPAPVRGVQASSEAAHSSS